MRCGQPRKSQTRISCAKLETALRPTGWMRPGDIPGIRDDVTLQWSSVPWVVVRDEPRPDDIRQGHVGNCWFVCAMSALAEEPANVRRVRSASSAPPLVLQAVRSVQAEATARASARRAPQ